jgi:LysE type translocator
VLAASATAFSVVKLAGAAHLVVIGVQALRAAARGERLASDGGARRDLSRAAASRRGLPSDLLNVKVGRFWTALVPQFVTSESSALLPAAMVGSMAAMVFAWLAAYAHLAARLSRAPRWATFDCYGTLVDWNAGIGAELGRLLGGDRAALLARYHQVEPRIQREHPDWSYRDVMAAVLAELASEVGVSLADEGRDALGRSLPSWPVFEEVPAALSEAHARGWQLVALSNSDRDFIEASMRAKLVAA